MTSQIESIIKGELRPDKADNKTDDFYEPEIRSLQPITKTFPSHFQINFIKPVMSAKVQYYKAFIDSIISNELNSKFDLLQDANENLVAYHRKMMQEKVDNYLNETLSLINRANYNLSEILASQIDYSVDLQRKECTYIFYYLILSLIRCYMEFQIHFSNQIEESKKRDVEYFFVRVLKISKPEKVGISEIQSIDEVVEPTKKIDQPAVYFKYKYLAKKSDYIKIMFDELKATKRISEDSSLTEFKHLFNGIKVDQPIQWIGLKSDLFYLFKQLKKLMDVPHECRYWEVIDNAFVDENGVPFGAVSLRDSKIAKTTQSKIESIAKLME